MRCPECNSNLIMQAFWQGRYVNCTSCGAKLQRSLAGIVLSALGGLASFVLAEYLLTGIGTSMEVEIVLSVIAMAAGYFAVHIATLRLKPKEESELKL